MKTSTKYILAGLASVTGALQIPGVQSLVQSLLGAFLSHHPGLAAIAAAVAGVAALLHNPKA